MSQAGVNNTQLVPGGVLETLTGNSGGAVGPDASHNINVVGNNSEGINIVGNPGTNTLTAAFSASTNQNFAFLGNLNIGNVLPNLNYNVNLQENTNGPIGMSINNISTGGSARTELWLETAGSGGTSADVDIVFNNSTSNHTWQIGMDNSDSDSFKISYGTGFDSTDAFRADQTTGAITFHNSYTFPTTIGSSNQVLNVNPAGDGTLIFSTFPVMTGFVVVTGSSDTMAPNAGYCANNSGLVTLTLPSTASVGSIIEVDGLGSGGWKIAQNSGQLIHLGSGSTTTGTGGSLASTNQYDSVTIRCVVANTTWVCTSMIGNITVV